MSSCRDTQFVAEPRYNYFLASGRHFSLNFLRGETRRRRRRRRKGKWKEGEWEEEEIKEGVNERIGRLEHKKNKLGGELRKKWKDRKRKREKERERKKEKKRNEWNIYLSFSSSFSCYLVAGQVETGGEFVPAAFKPTKNWRRKKNEKNENEVKLQSHFLI